MIFLWSWLKTKAICMYCSSVWKYAVICSPIFCLPWSQVPSSVFITYMTFCLLMIKVDKWNNLIFLSPSLSQISLDFCFQISYYLIWCSCKSFCTCVHLTCLASFIFYFCSEVNSFSKHFIFFLHMSKWSCSKILDQS